MPQLPASATSWAPRPPTCSRPSAGPAFRTMCCCLSWGSAGANASRTARVSGSRSEALPGAGAVDRRPLHPVPRLRGPGRTARRARRRGPVAPLLVQPSAPADVGRLPGRRGCRRAHVVPTWRGSFGPDMAGEASAERMTMVAHHELDTGCRSASSSPRRSCRSPMRPLLHPEPSSGEPSEHHLDRERHRDHHEQHPRGAEAALGEQRRQRPDARHGRDDRDPRSP